MSSDLGLHIYKDLYLVAKAIVFYWRQCYVEGLGPLLKRFVKETTIEEEQKLENLTKLSHELSHDKYHGLFKAMAATTVSCFLRSERSEDLHFFIVASDMG